MPRAGAQHPEDRIENRASILPRATATVFAARWLRDQWIENSPLRIGKITRVVTQHVEHTCFDECLWFAYGYKQQRI